ncbi:TniQ family protein (plasmid) [Rhizobium rhizogenes]|uniref:TniQ family protein n=1 Tax=Rhizobium rhizogenes TaxID=359 RepID=UPI001573F68E|nr:TniQ family protein [Rhizobium rhizogenes]NTI26761.1 TniQ family protein [Rhizobium rhizogenes]QTG10103.1 TniQ family protein [Rhizobium rhizogenes]
MTIFEGGPTVAIRARYDEVVSDRWPVFVRPQPGELLSSWAHRLAFANGIAPRSFGRVLGFSGGMWSPSLDMNFQSDAVTILSIYTGISLPQLFTMSLKGSPLKRLLLPLRDDGRRRGSAWLQFCPQCLADDAHPYFRRQWRLATRISCPHHRCGLRDRCPSCRSRIAAFNQVELVPQHFCVACAFDLRQASKVSVSPSVRSLDQCLNDICRLEAITGSLLNNSLIRRLLAVPDFCRQYPAASLVSLSTSARIRCFVRLAMRPNDWLIEDDDAVVALWRRSILSADGHALLIGLLANALERKRQRLFPAKRPQPTTELSTLLTAYLRMMENPRRRPA